MKRAGELEEVLGVAQDAVVRALGPRGAAAVGGEEAVAPPVAGKETAGHQGRIEVDAAFVEGRQREEYRPSRLKNPPLSSSNEMRFTTVYALLAGATAAFAAAAPQTPQEPSLCQKYPAGYFCADGINAPDSIVQCNPNGGSWLFIGTCRTNEYCWSDLKGQAFCRTK
ncbi:hypothetical protein VTG60DRAFT_3737 [Thermothelomyces hinnuleus]